MPTTLPETSQELHRKMRGISFAFPTKAGYACCRMDGIKKIRVNVGNGSDT